MNLQSLVGNSRKKHLTRAARRAARHTPRLRVESLEAREVPAVIPAPQVDQTSFRAIDNNAWAFNMEANPVNPNQLFGAFVTHGSNGTRVAYKFSTNGGTTWSSMGFFENSGDPKHLPQFVPFEEVSDPQVAWDRFGNVFVTYTQYHTDG